MKIMRRILGVLVMVAGILGLLISLAGIVMVWVAKPTVAAYANTTIDTLIESVISSQSVMEITSQALGATIDSVDALSAMLSTTAATVEDTQPVLDEIDIIMAETLPSTLKAATEITLYCPGGRSSFGKHNPIAGRFSFLVEWSAIDRRSGGFDWRIIQPGETAG